MERPGETTFESTTYVTQEEFFAFVEERAAKDRYPYHYELLNGRIVMNPPAGYPHGAVGGRILALLVNFVRERKLGTVFDSSQGFDLPSDDTVEPDVSFVSRERWEAAPPPVPGKFLRVVPDLVVEILSTSTASQDRGEKKGIYERNGVREYWLVDWRKREITVLSLEGGRYDRGRVLVEDERCASRVIEGFDLAVSDLFS